jgi:DNA-binding MarR family transcriptional regulator
MFPLKRRKFSAKLSTMKAPRQPTGLGLRHHAVLAWLRLARVFQQIDSRSERFFRGQGLNTAQFDVLAKVGAASGITQQELADALLVTKGNISQLLGKMEQDGLIVRRQEGRVNCLSLTERGRAKFAEVVPQQEALIADLLAPLTEDEQRDLLRLLRKLDHSLTR